MEFSQKSEIGKWTYGCAHDAVFTERFGTPDSRAPVSKQYLSNGSRANCNNLNQQQQNSLLARASRPLHLALSRCLYVEANTEQNIPDRGSPHLCHRVTKATRAPRVHPAACSIEHRAPSRLLETVSRNPNLPTLPL